MKASELSVKYNVIPCRASRRKLLVSFVSFFLCAHLMTKCPTLVMFPTRVSKVAIYNQSGISGSPEIFAH